MIAGYLRVSTCKQHLTNQKEEILRYAATRQITVDCWVTEIVSGKKHEKERKLGLLLRRLKPGDTLIVTEISSAFGLVAEIERNLISMRTKEALAMRKANGVVLGRRKGSCTKLKILMANSQTILKMLEDQYTILDICRHFNISRETFNKYRRLTPAAAEIIARNAAMTSTARRPSAKLPAHETGTPNP